MSALPTDPDALAARARGLLDQGKAAEAASLLQSAGPALAGRFDIMLTLAEALQRSGRPGEALALARRMRAAHPAEAMAQHAAGLMLTNLGALQEAVETYLAAQALAPARPLIRLQLGALYERLKRLDEAEAVYRELVAMAPQLPPADESLARTLLALARPEEALAVCRGGLTRFPGYAPLHAMAASVLQRIGRIGEAEAAYRQALALAPADAGTLNNFGLMLKEHGRLAEARDMLSAALRQAPTLLQASLNLSDVLTRLGEPAAAVAVCDACLRHHPTNGSVIAFKAMALRDAGRAAEADALVDHDRFIRTRRLRTPEGYASLEAFLAALSEEARATPSRPSEPGTADGRQTRELFPPETPALRELQAQFDEAVADYAADLPADPGHPFPDQRPARWHLSSWATIMLRVQEPEITHLHPDSWLSVVTYVALPEAVRDGSGQAGWIEFGRPAFNLYCAVPPPLRTFRPEAGLLVLFPGYFFHRILPFESASPRISIAFDSLPPEA